MDFHKINSETSSIWDCELIVLPQINTQAGCITALNNERELPFSARRIYYLYDVPSGSERGGHAHKGLYQLIVAGTGSFDVQLDDGIMKRIVTLNRPNIGLLVVPGIWRELNNFSSGAICLVIASQYYSEEDYIRGYSDFKSTKVDNII